METERMISLIQNEELMKFALSILSDTEQGALFSAIGMILLDRFGRTGSMEDLDRAITVNERAVESIPEGHPDRAAYLNNLGNALRNRFERTGSMEDLDRAITTNERAVESTSEDHPDLAGCLNNLGITLQRRFEQTGSMEDLDRAIRTNERAVESTPEGHPDLGRCLNGLGVALRSRFERMGSMDDLIRAITTSERAVESTPEDHPDLAIYLNNLGIALQSRFEWTGLMEDLDRAITTNERVVESIPEGHPNLAGCLNNLGCALWRRFGRTGSTEDLDRAIMINERAIESTSEDHHNLSMHLNNLGIALQSRFERTGLINDLDYAITSTERAIEATPESHPNIALYLNNLGNALRIRFDRTGSMEDLDRAIVINEGALETTPEGHPDLAARLNNLGNALQSRFERTGSMEDLDCAITANERAVKLTPEGHPNLAVCLNSLGIALQSRFERTGSMEDLDHAIITKERAVESTPESHPDLALYLNNLGNALRYRFEKMGSMENLDRAITTYEWAVESTLEGHPDLATRLNNLGIALQRRFERTGSMEDLDRAIITNERALASDTAPPSIRLKAANCCSNLLINQGSYTRAKSVLDAAVQLLPAVSPRQLKRSDQQFNISQFSNITSRAVSLHLADADDRYKSLQLFELGRGILSNLQLEVRSDISNLAISHPDIARQFQELRDQIDSPSNSFEPSIIKDSLASFNSTSTPDLSKFIFDRRALLKQFDDLLQYIRSLRGFERFLRGPSESELQSLAEEGAIVVFNVSDIRSDAFLISADEIRSVHLPLLTSDSLADIAKRFLEAINEDPTRQRHANRQMNSILGDLWDIAVKPVLDELGFTRTPLSNEEWPRVWWIGSGLLSILPIHASGYHDTSPPQTALDRVISSYAATIKSLAYARERAKKADQNILREKAVLLAMPTTPEQESLPFVETEIKELENLFSNASIDITIIRNPVKAAALSELSTYSIVHFACHGYSANDPSQSSLLLEDWKTEPLTVSDLISMNIESAKFAYLSACHTSTMRDFHLLDETINLSSAIQLSGYPSVLGSLWTVVDSYSAEIAKTIYKCMLTDGKLDGRRSAEGLHKAVRTLRDKTRARGRFDDAISWASYVHIGI